MDWVRRALTLALLVSAAACTADTVDATDDGSDDGDPDEGIVAACGLPASCEPYSAYCRAGDDYSGCASEPYPESLVCMLDVLATGERSQLHVSVGPLDEWLDIAVYGPDEALYQYGVEYADYTIHHRPPQQCALKAPEWFEACLADMGGDAQHIACMNPYEWFEECTGALECL